VFIGKSVWTKLNLLRRNLEGWLYSLHVTWLPFTLPRLRVFFFCGNYEFVMAETVKFTVFWVVTPCILVKICLFSWGTFLPSVTKRSYLISSKSTQQLRNRKIPIYRKILPFLCLFCSCMFSKQPVKLEKRRKINPRKPIQIFLKWNERRRLREELLHRDGREFSHTFATRK
jgi:hypothetical protein